MALKAKRILAKSLVLLLPLALLGALCGCRTLGFYSQAIKGQYEIVFKRRSVEKVLADADTDAALRTQLQLLLRLRSFAEQQLKLPANGHYLKYVDVHRPFVVWNVEAAPEFSMEAKTWWYPVVGSLDYRGYFSQRGATNYAAWLQSKGYDVYVGGVEAYSTLGWFKDPALNTFIFNPEADLAETIFHELAHQRVFASGDTEFNEAFATSVGQEGARRWLQARGDTNACGQYETELQRTRQFAHLIMETRLRLAAAFGDVRAENGKLKAARGRDPINPAPMRAQKQEIFVQLQKEYAQLKTQWGGSTQYDGWFSRPINNAQLNSVAAYHDLVPGFERMLQENNGEMEKFYQAAEALSKTTKQERRRRLRVNDFAKP